MKAAHFRIWSSVLIAALGLFSSLAVAQSTPSAGANGIKIGEGRLHPFFDLELHFDSAAGFFPRGGVVSTTLQPEVLAHFRPGLRLELPSDNVALDASGNVDYVYYTGLLTPFSQATSRLEAAADINANFNPKGTVGVTLGEQLRRGDRTHNAALGVGVISLFNEARVAVPIRPGGGALEVTPKAAVTVEFFDPISDLPVPQCAAGDASCTPAAVRLMNYLNIRPGVEGRWKFLPKTAFVLDATLDVRSYLATGNTNAPATLLKASVGLAGLVTPKVSVVAKAGWGYDFANSGADTVLAQLEGTYLLSETASIRGGYLRTLEPVPTYGTYGDDRAYVEGKLQFSGRLIIHGVINFDYLSFYKASNRNDTVFTLDVGPDYEVLPWLLVSGGYMLSTHYSSGSTAVSLNYTRNEAYLRVTFQY